MRKLALLTAAFALVAATLYGCDEESPTEPADVAVSGTTAPSLAAVKKPVSPDAYYQEYSAIAVPAGGRGYNSIDCPLGTFPVGGYFTILKPGGGRLDDYSDIGIINAGVYHDTQGEGAAGFTAGVDNQGTVALELGIRVFCFDGGFLSGHQGQ